MGTEKGKRTMAALVEFAPAVFILTKKITARNHIVVGEDPAQVRFLEQQLGIEVEQVDRITDDMLVGREGMFLRVYAAHRIDLSPEMRNRTAFWSAEPIVKGSAAINALVKFAATLLPYPDKKLTREIVEIVGDHLTESRIYDVRGCLWEAVWLLAGDVQKRKVWRDPWNTPTQWLDSSMDIERRLSALYKKVVGYSTLVTKGADAARKLGVKPRQIQYFRELSLDPTRVYKTLALLSRWKQGRVPSYPCALQIAAIWQ